jgi:hypothetical protein
MFESIEIGGELRRHSLDEANRHSQAYDTKVIAELTRAFVSHQSGVVQRSYPRALV